MAHPGLKDFCLIPVIVTDSSLNFVGDFEFLHLTYKQPEEDTSPVPTWEEETNHPKSHKQQPHHKEEDIMEVKDLHPDSQ
jgi:hypothetical protein